MKAWVLGGVLVAVVAVGGCDREAAPAQNSMETTSPIDVVKLPGTAPGPIPIPYPNTGMTGPAAKSGAVGGKLNLKSPPDGGGTTVLLIPGLQGNDGG